MILKEHFSKWCVWRTVPNPTGGKPGKLPINPNTGRGGQTNAPETFGTLEQAQAALARDDYAGLGVLMSSGGSVVCVDVDDCIGADGAPNGTAAWALDTFKGYCEVSQSGKGLHFFMMAAKPAGCQTKVTHEGCSLEIYAAQDKRFLCITERAYRDTCGEVVEEQAALDQFIARFGFVKVDAAPTACPDTDNESDSETHSDDEIIKLLKRNTKRGKITRLWAGKIEDYTDNGKGKSEADGGLACEIAYYTTDPAQLERIFNRSELAKRDKWQKRADYRRITIKNALNITQNYYWDDIKKSQRKKSSGAEGKWASGAENLTGGLEGLRLSKSGKPLSDVGNALQILLRDQRTQGAMGFNLFSGEPEVLRPLREVFGPAASDKVGQFEDYNLTAFRAWLNNVWGVALNKSDADDVVIAWARHAEFDPVGLRLEQCEEEWNGVYRLDTWLQVYLGVETEGVREYVQSVGRKWLIGAVARVMNPGCKMDSVLVLEGAQGAGKSTAVRILAEAVYAPGFVENLPPLGSNEETRRALQGAFIVELAELSAIQGKAETEHIKAFLTTQEDSVRPLYGKRFVRRPRTVSFFGTTNEGEYLRDATGGRRFWCVRVGKIDTDKLRADAAQLWGEAVHAFRNGETWHLQEAAALKQAEAQQKERQISDSWDDAINEFADKEGRKSGAAIERWQMKDLFRAMFPGLPQLDEKLQGEQKRFAGALRKCGFEQKKSRGLSRWRLTDEKICEVRES